MARGDRLFDNVDIESLNDRQLHVINAVDASIFRCLEKYEVIYQIILQQKTDMASNLVYLVWELADWLERTRKLLGLGVGFDRKTIHYREAVSGLKKVENLRHKLQHFDRFVSSSVSNNQALLGSVTACVCEGIESTGKHKRLRFESYNLGLLRAEKSLGSIEMPVRMLDTVDHVILHLGSESVNLSEILRKLLKFYQEARVELQQEYPISGC
ncbi:MAG: hypothetical protein AAFN63_14635 [Pseudomonadota bacterium]